MIQVVDTALGSYVNKWCFRVLREVVDTDPVLRSLRSLATDLVDQKAVPFAAHFNGASFRVRLCHKVPELHRQHIGKDNGGEVAFNHWVEALEHFVDP